jgi:regulator of protease activity HflC (stomatin/prohibitin superfamily)
MNYAVVLEKFGGVREAVTAVGWHARLPFFTRIEQEVTLMNQRLSLGGRLEPMRIISKENVSPVDFSVAYLPHQKPAHLGN